MNIIFRNLIRLLRSGMFNEFDAPEPMSPFKWRRMMHVAVMLEVDGIVVKGAKNFTELSKHPALTAPPSSAKHSIQSLMEEAISEKQFSNMLLNHKLQKIYKAELSEEESSEETLQILNLIIYNTTCLLRSDVSVMALLLLGKFLRTKGDRVDFIKIQAWLKTLGLEHFASLFGSMMQDVFAFDADELPFMEHHLKEAVGLFEKTLLRTLSNQKELADEHIFSENDAGFVTMHSGGLRRNIRSTFRYFSYSPSIATAAFLTRLSENLDGIEE